MRTQGFQRITFFILPLMGLFTLSLSAAAQGTNFPSNLPNTTLHGNPPSVTSFGFGGQPGFHGVPASVTSPNFGSAPFQFPQQFPQQFQQRPIFSPHRHRDRGFVSPFFTNVIAVPYAYPVYVEEPGVDDSMEQEDYRGGPTIFDRRGPGTNTIEEEYIRRERRDRDERDRNEDDYRVAAPAQPAPQAEVANQPRTVLVFKDGRHVEILNYAIVGSTLFDLSDGRTRKVALADLDLPATVKENDDRGVDFQLPAGTKTN